ncbi:MAG: 50S ribosomal protein L25 [Rubrobacteraceae bacterium]|uniref:50S ribosomal protein L25 n=1 Tax=Rubrobacter naiadicus TaxID=1392641 RepID=UPI00235F2785|nr:50S ribosomal protein L25 [Rubrobacter naiadicus]MBX6762810.1 50S ribosomal protein L25 [Rubrobacteraceae bacterium]MCL6437326.1 50S ribosomal protein L25 [Rubrobacteraceae bacterium]
MPENVSLRAEERERRGKNDARRLRAAGMLPAVLYGNGPDGGRVMAVPAKVIDQTIHHLGDNALYDIELPGSEKATARIVDVQRDPLTGRLLHVDFAPVNMTERIEVTVPVVVSGEAPGAKEGGVLQQVLYEVQVESLPGNIPQELEIDVSNLGMGENLTLGEIELPEGVTLVSDPEEVVVTVTTPTEITEEEAAEAGIAEEQPEEAAEATPPEAPSGEDREESEE